MIILSMFYKNKRGGFNKRLYKLYEDLCNAGHHVHFMGSEDLPLRHRAIHQHIAALPFSRSENMIYWFFFIFNSFFKSFFIARTHRIESIVTFGPFYTLLCALPIILLRIPATTFIRADNMKHSRNKVRNAFFFIIDYLGIKLSRRIVFVSSALERNYQELYRIPQKKSFVLPNNIDSLYRIEKEKKDELRSRLNVTPDTFLLSTMGDINRIKNHEYIIRAMTHLNNANVKLMLIGDDLTDSGERKRLEVLVQSLSLADKVLFCGWQDEPLQYIACSDFFVFPSKYEGSPNALLEALSCGVPCIGSDIEEIKELLEYTDLLFPLNNDRDLADMIGKASVDTVYYKWLCRMSQERCNKFMFDWGQSAVSLVTAD
ncbi:MAG: glycosyltransferase family 4 protein [Pseudomonadota bacterium]